MSGGPSDDGHDGLDDLVAAADEAARELPSFDDVTRKAKQAGNLARQAMGSLTPVDSGVKMNPRLRVTPPKNAPPPTKKA